MDNEPTPPAERRPTRGRGVARSPPAPHGCRVPHARQRQRRRDAVQEAYARLVRNGVDGIDDVRGWLVTVTSRLCLDQLRSAQSQRTSYVGPWMPEPVVDVPSLGVDPADRVTLDDSVRMALLVVLDSCPPPSAPCSCSTTCSSCRSRRWRRSSGGHRRRAGSSRAAPGATSRPKPRRGGSGRRRRATAARGAVRGRGEQRRPRGAARSVGPRRVRRRRLRRGHPRCPRQAVTGRKASPPICCETSAAAASSRAVDVNGEPGVIGVQDGRIVAAVVLESGNGTIHHIHAI